MSARERINEAAKQRVLIFDGAFGTQIQNRKLTEEEMATSMIEVKALIRILLGPFCI